MNYKHFSDIYTGEQEFEREKMQFLFDKSFREKNENLLRNQYIRLRRFQFNENLTFHNECVELSSLAENVTIACDILATDSGVGFIYCGDGPCHIKGNSHLIIKALLNLLSNAYLYGKGHLVTVKTLELENYCGIQVINCGRFDENYHAGKGIPYIYNVCSGLKGNFFIEQTLSQTKAIMLFEKATDKTDICTNENDIVSLVSDRLSPACIEMFGMEYH